MGEPLERMAGFASCGIAALLSWPPTHSIPSCTKGSSL